MIETSIGERIAELRNMAGLSQSALAKRIELTPKAIKNLETGISKPSADTIIRLCNIFNVSADCILCIDSDETISLREFDRKDQQIIRAIIQAFIRVKEQQ